MPELAEFFIQDRALEDRGLLFAQRPRLVRRALPREQVDFPQVGPGPIRIRGGFQSLDLLVEACLERPIQRVAHERCLPAHARLAVVSCFDERAARDQSLVKQVQVRREPEIRFVHVAHRRRGATVEQRPHPVRRAAAHTGSAERMDVVREGAAAEPKLFVGEDPGRMSGVPPAINRHVTDALVGPEHCRLLIHRRFITQPGQQLGRGSQPVVARAISRLRGVLRIEIHASVQSESFCLQRIIHHPAHDRRRRPVQPSHHHHEPVQRMLERDRQLAEKEIGDRPPGRHVIRR